MKEDDPPLQTAKELRNTHFPCQSDGPSTQLKDYLEDLQQKGVLLNPKLFPSKFHLKNGLPYTGMATKQSIGAGEVLIRVPEDLILSTNKVIDEPNLQQVYREKFFLSPTSEIDQDRVLIVYCLFLLSKKQEENLWFQMVKRFPKQCDIACFWSEQQLDQFKDKTVKSAANHHLEDFQKQWKLFQEIKTKHNILQQPQFNKQNYRIVYITLSNRAFGYKVKYVSLVPLAEYFNHHSSKVSYFLQKEKQTYLTDQSLDSNDNSSEGSCDSYEMFEQDQFAYEKVAITPLDWSPDSPANLNQEQKQQIQQQLDKISIQLEEELTWKDFSVLFVANLAHKVNSMKKQYLEGKKPYDRIRLEISIVNKTIKSYLEQVNQYYQRSHHRDYLPKIQEKKKQSKFPPKHKKQYESLILKTGKLDQFTENNQVYFRYGYKCNRSLLLHYGFAIEGNKYEHYWTSFNLGDCLSQFPDTLQKVVQKKLSLLRKFKVYHHKLNLDLIVFFRLNSWVFYGERAVQDIFYVSNLESELAILEQITNMLQQYAEIYDDQYDLNDPTVNYHQYFTMVYHKEKFNLLKRQIQMFHLITNVLSQIYSGSSLEEAAKSLTATEKNILNPYLSTLRL